MLQVVMQEVISWIGLLVVTSGGLVAASGILWWLTDRAFKWWCTGLDINDLCEAVEEWRERHPEKARANDERSR
jgi:endonuclease/exonuclease/phosphatase (EEP) superfamily protein YafD